MEICVSCRNKSKKEVKTMSVKETKKYLSLIFSEENKKILEENDIEYKIIEVIELEE